MKKEKGLVMRTVCVVAGVGLLAGAMALFALWRWGVHHSTKQAESYVNILRSSIPESRDVVLQERRDNTMSVLPVDGTDFVGIIEMPDYDSALPVSALWGESSEYPCCFSGSVYDGTLKIGATTQKGQYDFYRDLSVDDTVVYTDMEGNRYTFAITSMRYEKHADQAALQREDAALTLFVKNIYSFEYLIIFCNVSLDC